MRQAKIGMPSVSQSGKTNNGSSSSSRTSLSSSDRAMRSPGNDAIHHPLDVFLVIYLNGNHLEAALLAGRGATEKVLGGSHRQDDVGVLAHPLAPPGNEPRLLARFAENARDGEFFIDR